MFVGLSFVNSAYAKHLLRVLRESGGGSVVNGEPLHASSL